MKTRTFKQKENLYEIIVPFGVGEPPEGGLYDDCPICQRLKRQMESGEVEVVGLEDSDE